MNSNVRYIVQGQDLTYLEKEALNNEEIKNVMRYFIGKKEADISLLPTVIIPMVSSIKGKQYRIRSLLDSGSMTNWIAKDLLKMLKYTVKGNNLLELNTLTGTIQKRFQLVEVYYLYRNIEYNLTCYVHEEFTKYVTVDGLPEYIKENRNITQEQMSGVAT